MKTLDRARLIAENCHNVVGAKYNIFFDNKYGCYRVLRVSRGQPANYVLIESSGKN